MILKVFDGFVSDYQGVKSESLSRHHIVIKVKIDLIFIKYNWFNMTAKIKEFKGV